MSQMVYVTPSRYREKSKTKSVEIDEDTGSNETHIISIESNLIEDKPVEIIDGAIEITEDLLKENMIYPIEYRCENYYVQRKGKSIEIFQISENE